MVANFINNLANAFSTASPALIYHPLNPTAVDNSDDYITMEAGRHYIRLWAAHVFLAKKTTFLQSWFPAVHALVQFDFQGAKVEFPTVSDASRVALNQSAGSGDVVARNYAITPLIPFNDGTISLNAGLIAVEGANTLNNLITTLSDFSSLLAVPQFSTALKVAEPLGKGLQALLAMGGVHLALNDTLSTGSMGGYRAVVRATPQQINKTELRVRNKELNLVNQFDHNLVNPLTGFDFMLFRIEVTEKGPDFRSLTAIQEPMKLAYAALKEMEDTKAEGFYRTAIIAAHQAPELTNADRARVKLQMRDDFKALKNDLSSGLTGGDYDLTESMKKAIPIKMALQLGDPSWDELFQN
jgi:hypothetical protein